MKYPKRIAALGAATAAAALLAACGGAPADGGTTGGEGDAEAMERTTTVDQGAGDDATNLVMWTFGESHATFYETMAAAWNEENPDRQVFVDSRVFPFQPMHQRLTVALQTGIELPDIVDIEVQHFSRLVRGEQTLFDLTPYAEPYRDDIVPARMDLYTRDGKLLGLPLHVGAIVAFYNVPLLEEAGVDWTGIQTWDDFREAGVKYKEATGREFGISSVDGSFNHLLVAAQHGAEFTDSEGVVTMNTPEMVASFELLQGLHEAGATGLIPGGNPDHEEAYGAIGNGDFAAVIMPAWYMSRYMDSMPQLEGDIAIAPAPVLEGGAVATVGGGGTGTAVPLKSEHRELAAEFIAFAKLSEAGNVTVWDQLGFDPVNMGMWTDRSVTHNPESRPVQFFYNSPFDALLQVKDSIGHVESLTTEAWPAIHSRLMSETLNDLFEVGVPAAEALEQAEADLRNELRQ